MKIKKKINRKTNILTNFGFFTSDANDGCGCGGYGCGCSGGGADDTDIFFFSKDPGGVNVGDHIDDDAGGDCTVDDDDSGAKWAAGGVEDAVGIEAEG